MIRGQLSGMQRDAAWEGKSRSEREATTAFNLNLGGEDNARAAGVRVTAAGQAREVEYLGRKRSEDRFRDAIQRVQLSERAQAVYDALGDYGDQLRDELARRQRRSNELNDRIEANETILVLLNSGQLDRDNPLHLELMDRAGLDPDLDDDELRDTAEDNLDADRQERSANDARIAEIERQLPLVEAARERIEDGEDPDAVLRDLAGRGIHIEVESNDREAVAARLDTYSQDLEIERLGQQPAIEAVDDAATDNQPTLDSEIETFMRALANNQAMLSGAALQSAMQGQIDELSDDAREQLEATEETAFLFDGPQSVSTPESAERTEQASVPVIGPGSNL